jgi:phosphoribosylformylglycinamidine cyclo-ligase
MCGLKPDTVVPELKMSVADALLAPHRSYLRVTRPLLERSLVKGMAHITGGGMTENLPRILPEGCDAAVVRGAWEVPELFKLLQRKGDIPEEEMFRAFNMGIGLIIVCANADADRVRELLERTGESGAPLIGHVLAGDRRVRYI